MKFFGSFIIFALINVLSVFAGPPPAKYTTDGTFEYYLIYESAYIIRVLNKNSKELVIRPYVYYEGNKYSVTSINQGLSESKVENIIIQNDFQHTFYLGSDIGNAKYLKSIEVNAKDVRVGTNTFENVKRSVILKGKGLESMALNYALEVIKSYNENPTTYTSTTSAYQRKQHLYSLARTLKNNGNLGYSSNISNADSALHTLLYKEGSMLGVARAFRIYALAKGFNAGDIKVVGDNKYYNWNIVKLDNTWYNFDIIHTVFKSGQGDVSVFYTDDEYNTKFLKPFYGYGVSPSNWIIYNAEYGYQYEVSGAQTENLASWIEKNRWNGVYHGHGRA